MYTHSLLVVIANESTRETVFLIAQQAINNEFPMPLVLIKNTHFRQLYKNNDRPLPMSQMQFLKI